MIDSAPVVINSMYDVSYDIPTAFPPNLRMLITPRQECRYRQAAAENPK
jgi:hypothetical protein